eukprot:CAMPEP_0117508302 /NCGR_PEP_ID=MMETSP0784-20121206/26877_1 /TAXON_ID=39447 /ORGANISM="" /LENGTH=497 /DNA_ID=CAMNT_0005303849 /DNA_START=56 /DNA_END=1549 /DNA_ORIENTATION=+
MVSPCRCTGKLVLLYFAELCASSGTHPLGKLVTRDFDALAQLDGFQPKVMNAFMNSVGALMLRFSGFSRNATGSWVKSDPSHRLERWPYVTPAYKAARQRAWVSDAEAELRRIGSGDFLVVLSVAAKDEPVDGGIGVTGTTMADVVRKVEEIWRGEGFSLQSFDGVAAAAFGEMFHFAFDAPRSALLPGRGSAVAFSFGNSKDEYCRCDADCRYPGLMNEMLAWTLVDYMSEHPNDTVYAQWEVAVALRRLVQGDAGRASRVVQLGGKACNASAASSYLSTADIMNACFQDVETDGVRRLLVLAHPDHLPRAYFTAQTALRRAQSKGRFQALRLVPGMAPYSLDWPGHPPGASVGPGSVVDMYANSTRGYTLSDGTTRSWYPTAFDSSLGYLAAPQDGQEWVLNRKVFLLYEMWARSEGVYVGAIDSRSFVGRNAVLSLRAAGTPKSVSVPTLLTYVSLSSAVSAACGLSIGLLCVRMVALHPAPQEAQQFLLFANE